MFLLYKFNIDRLLLALSFFFRTSPPRMRGVVKKYHCRAALSRLNVARLRRGLDKRAAYTM